MQIKKVSAIVKIKENMEAYSRMCSGLILNGEKSLNEYPGGKLIITTSNSKAYYYYQDPVTGDNISLRNNGQLLATLLERDKLKERITILKHNQDQMNSFLTNYVPILPDSDAGFIRPTKGNSFMKDKLIHNTGHNLVRSKSELAICLKIESYGLEYAYECEVEANGVITRPDFAIKRPRDHRLIYLEHCGMIGDARYCKNLAFKIQNYSSAGIRLWDNLILTFDGEDGSLDMAYIEKVFNLYIL